MQNLRQQVEDYTGETIDDLGALDRWLNSAVDLVTDLIPDERSDEYSTEVSVTTGGLSLSTYRLVRAFKSNKEAKMVPAGRYGALQDSSSLHYPSTAFPASVIHDGKLYVFPGGGHASVITKPVLGWDSENVADMPEHITTMVVLWTAIQWMLRRLSDAASEVSVLAYITPTAPTAPSPPVISFSNASVGTFTATTIGALPAAPTYSAVSDSLGAALTTAYTNLNAALNTDQDIEFAGGQISEIQARIEQARTSYMMLVQDHFNSFQASLAEYQSGVQKVMEQARLDQERLGVIARMTTDVNVSNAAKTLEAAIADYQLEVSNYQAQVGAYGVQVQQAGTKYQADIARLASTVQQRTAALGALRSQLYELFQMHFGMGAKQ